MIDANVIQSAIEQHVKDRHMGFDQSDSYWLRVFAGQAMQTVISEVTWGVDDANFHQPPVDRIAITSVAIAEALLEEVKRVEDV